MRLLFDLDETSQEGLGDDGSFEEVQDAISGSSPSGRRPTGGR